MSKHIRVAYKGLKSRRAYLCAIATIASEQTQFPKTITQAKKILRHIPHAKRWAAREAYFNV